MNNRVYNVSVVATKTLINIIAGVAVGKVVFAGSTSLRSISEDLGQSVAGEASVASGAQGITNAAVVECC